MAQSINSHRHISLVLAIAAGTVVSNSNAQQVLTYASYAGQITINVPKQIPGPACTAVPRDAPTDAMILKRTFYDMFDSIDLKSSKWTPHYNAGYDEASKTWLGNDWIVKRTQPSAHEQQLYVDPAYKGTTSQALGINPFIVENGLLHIVAQRTPMNLLKVLSNFEYTSGLLTTRQSHIQRYGYFEARIKVPSTQGLLPAFWLLPSNKTWPPELDIMEAPTHLKDTIQHTAHYLDAAGVHQGSACRTIYNNYSAGFHQYGALWTAQKIVYYIDRVPVGQLSTPMGMNLPMYMMINLAVGGDWIGKATLATPMPVEMIVDNVVAYSQDGLTACKVQANGVTQCPDK